MVLVVLLVVVTVVVGGGGGGVRRGGIAEYCLMIYYSYIFKEIFRECVHFVGRQQFSMQAVIGHFGVSPALTRTVKR